MKQTNQKNVLQVYQRRRSTPVPHRAHWEGKDFATVGAGVYRFPIVLYQNLARETNRTHAIGTPDGYRRTDPRQQKRGPHDLVGLLSKLRQHFDFYANVSIYVELMYVAFLQRGFFLAPPPRGTRALMMLLIAGRATQWGGGRFCSRLHPIHFCIKQILRTNFKNSSICFFVSFSFGMQACQLLWQF